MKIKKKAMQKIIKVTEFFRNEKCVGLVFNFAAKRLVNACMIFLRMNDETVAMANVALTIIKYFKLAFMFFFL